MENLPGAPHRLAGHRLDDPETGRFLSADPLGLSAWEAMSAGVWENPDGGSCAP